MLPKKKKKGGGNCDADDHQRAPFRHSCCSISPSRIWLSCRSLDAVGSWNRRSDRPYPELFQVG